ncbi:hypothetical protein Tco_0714872, partial [Tanacetum coccineum]
RVTRSSRSSRSGDHRRSRRDSPEYDRREGWVVIIVVRDGSEPTPHHGIDYTNNDHKKSRYKSSRRTGVA